ncbi:MAG: SpoIIE family protein phosphatase [candidate division Zixibacteria bacterium]
MTDHADHTRTEKLLLEAARTFNSTLDYEELMGSVLRLILKAVDCDGALVFRVDHSRNDVRIRMMKRGEGKVHQQRHEISESIAGYALKYAEPVVVNEAQSDDRVDHGMYELSGIKVSSLLTVPLIGKGQMIGVVEALNGENGGFSEQDQDIIVGLTNQIAVAIDNSHLMRELKREALERELLMEVSKKLSGSLQLDDVLDEILKSLKQVVYYDLGGVFLIDPKTNELVSIYAQGYPDDIGDALHLKLGQGLVGVVANSGEGLIVPDVSKDSRYVSGDPLTKSEVVVPIKLNGSIIGAINLESHQLNAFDERSLSVIIAFASHAAISLERARLHESMLSGKKLEEQLNVARTIQQSFLPEEPPEISGYDVHGSNVSSGQVGGDYFDYIKIVDSQYGMTVADVSGKGVPAALIMASYRASLIAEIRNNYSIRAICEKVNRLLVESVEPGNYVTAVYGVLDSRNNIYTYANCGHNWPILLRSDGSVEYLAEGGPVLGVTDLAVFQEQAIFMNPGDIILLYTDGVTEVFDSSGTEFGLERLVATVRENRPETAADIEAAIYRAVRKFASSEHLFDDFTLMVIKRLLPDSN